MYLAVSSSRQSARRTRRKLNYKWKQVMPEDIQDANDASLGNDKEV